MIAYTFDRAETATVEIKETKAAADQSAAQGQGAAGASSALNPSKGPMLFPGLRIAPGRLESPLNTDKTRYASATITAGPLAGAFLIGQSTPMTDRKSGVLGKRVDVRVVIGGGRSIKKKKTKT